MVEVWGRARGGERVGTRVRRVRGGVARVWVDCEEVCDV